MAQKHKEVSLANINIWNNLIIKIIILYCDKNYDNPSAAANNHQRIYYKLISINRKSYV